MPLTPQLIDAYRKAHYTVEDLGVLRIGVRNAALEALLDSMGARSAAFVTPFNPRGVRQSDEQNRAALAALEASLAFPYRRGAGRDPEGRWPDEPSLLVIGIERAAAEVLGRALHQNAIVFVEKGLAVELLLLVKMRLVLDTQVWLDWLVFDDPASFGLRNLVATERAEIFIDAACAAELERVLAYPLGRRTLDVAGQSACLAKCHALAKRLELEFESRTPKALPACRDPDDQKFLELAAAAGADCLVTRDLALLELAPRVSAFRILKPEAFSSI